MEFKVTAAAQRPVRMDGKCFYCDQPIGDFHNDDCVLINKTVKVRLTVEYQIKVPAHWTKDHIEFHRNEGSWCSDNAIHELEALSEKENCLCHIAHFECLNDQGEPFLSED